MTEEIFTATAILSLKLQAGTIPQAIDGSNSRFTLWEDVAFEDA